MVSQQEDKIGDRLARTEARIKELIEVRRKGKEVGMEPYISFSGKYDFLGSMLQVLVDMQNLLVQMERDHDDRLRRLESGNLPT